MHGRVSSSKSLALHVVWVMRYSGVELKKVCGDGRSFFSISGVTGNPFLLVLVYLGFAELCGVPFYVVI